MVDPAWSLESLLQDYDPQSGWRSSFATAYALALETSDPEERLDGWQSAAMIFGDMGAAVFCLFVSYHALTLAGPSVGSLPSHINLCWWDMGLAKPARVNESGGVPITSLNDDDTFLRNEAAKKEWLTDQLRPFGGDLEPAALFAMRLTAVKFDMLRGPANPSFDDVLDESLWERIR